METEPRYEDFMEPFGMVIEKFNADRSSIEVAKL